VPLPRPQGARGGSGAALAVPQAPTNVVDHIHTLAGSPLILRIDVLKLS